MALADAANAAADQFSGPRSGTTRIGCSQAPNGFVPAGNSDAGCADFDWHISLWRNATITAKRDGQGVAMAVPVRFSGTGGFRGDIAKTMKMNSKAFSGTFVVSISGVLRPDKSFCPKLDQAVTKFAWGTPPDVSLIDKTCLDAGNGLKLCVGPWKVPVGTMLTDQINHSLAAQVNAINGKIACDDVRNGLKQVWKRWTLPVTLPNSPTFYASVEPRSLSVPGVIANDNSVEIVARLDATTSVSTQKPAADTPQPELPQNAPLATEAGRFDLHVPLAIPYTLLASAPSAGIVGKPVAVGQDIITPIGLEIFPSNNELAISVTFRVDAKGKLQNQEGIVWYTAAPAIGNDGHLIKLNNLAMTARTNTPLWAMSKAVDALSGSIASTYSYDLCPLVRDAQAKLNQAISDPKNTGGANIKVVNDDLKLGRLVLLQTVFAVEGVFDADVSVTLPGSHG